MLPDETIKAEPHDFNALKALDYYTEGDYASAAEVSRQLLLQLPTAVQFFELYVKSLIYSGRPFESPFPPQSPANEIVCAIDSVFRKTNGYSQALDTLSRAAKSLHITPLAAGLRYLLAAEGTPSTARRSEQIAILDSQFLNPKLCFVPSKLSLRQDVHKRITVIFPGSLTMDFLAQLLKPVDATGIVNYPDRVNTERKLRYTATILLERGDYSSAIPLLEKLYSGRQKVGTPVTYPLYDEIIALLYDAYVRAENIPGALDIFVDNLLDQPLTIHGLDVLALHKIIERVPRPALASNIKVPIFYAATLANPQSIFVPYDNFLSAHGCKRPTDLLSMASIFPLPLLTYFLSRVCIQKVMAGSFHFTGTAELENERLQILQHLCRTNPANRPAYSEEIDQITQRLFIRRGIQKLDEGKIFVDVLGIRRTGEKLLAENFRRYLDISSLKGIEALRLLDTNITKVVLTTPDGHHVPEQKIDIDKLEAEGVRVIFRSHYALFKDLFIDVRDRFISSSEYGLDSYLSVRIRHGTLQGQLRSRFEAFHLLTQKNADTGEYQRNTYWETKLPTCTLEEKEFIQALLAALSRDIDDLTRRLKDDVIQVRTESRNPNGLFDFRFDDESLAHMFSEEFESITSFAEFMDKVFATLWSRTEEGCARMRDFMSHGLKSEFVHCLTKLQTDLRSHLQPGAASNLLAAIANGLTAVQNECDRIARWFTLPGGTFEAFTLYEIMSVCVASVNNVNPEVQISPKIDMDSRPITGSFFPSFFDILRAVLDNALRHSGFTGTAPQVSITGRIVEDKIVIRMQNSIAPHVREKDPAQILSDRIAAIRSRAVSDEIKREGGTGYVKIAKILEYDLHQHDPRITFAYPTDQELQVTLELSGKELFA
jgi:tetratricopeptide (TPR) repeat protein